MDAPLDAEGWPWSLVVAERSVLFGGFQDGRLVRWDIRTGQRLAGEARTGWVRSLAVVGPVVFSGSDDGALRRWDAETGLPLGEPISAAPVRGMTARGAADGLVIATGSPDALIAVWRPTA